MIDQVDIDLRAALLPVRDQGPRPTCLAHAASAAHERARVAMVSLSPEYLHFFATGGLISTGCSMEATAKALVGKGQPAEADCPYLMVPPPAGWRPPTGLQVFRRVSEAKGCTAAEIEEAVRARRLPVLGISLPESFFRPQAPWVISLGGTIRGLHAVAGAGVGRHQGRRVILIRNSWGPSWADAGYAWLDETFITQHLKHVLVLTDEVA
jgi:hypothetical protein